MSVASVGAAVLMMAAGLLAGFAVGRATAPAAARCAGAPVVAYHLPGGKVAQARVC